MTVVVTFALRMAAVRFDLQSKPLSAFEEDWAAREQGEVEKKPETP